MHTWLAFIAAIYHVAVLIDATKESSLAVIINKTIEYIAQMIIRESQWHRGSVELPENCRSNIVVPFQGIFL